MKNLEVKTENVIKTIVLSKLIAHPDNPNVMSEATFRKLVRNIERTGLYEPIVVRCHPEKEGSFQIINGHHRVKALEQLKHEEADCVVWEVDDEETAILLTTLNRLGGSDIPAKKIELLKNLSERMGTAQLAKLLPQTAKHIERLAALKDSVQRTACSVQYTQFAVPLVFFVTKEQQGVIENAIEAACSQTVTPSEVEGSVKIDSSTRPDKSGLARNDKQSKAQRRAAAITEMAERYLREVEKCQK